MAHQAEQRNPFMLLLHPEVILAAMEKSERLGQLNRHLCRPLDRPAPATGANAPAAVRDEDDEDEPLASAE